MTINYECRTKEIMFQVEAGDYLKNLRESRSLSLRELGEEVGLTAPYLSEIERGLKVPSTNVIKELSRFYHIEEYTLFIKYNKTPVSALELLQENVGLQIALAKLVNMDNKDDIINEFVSKFE